MQSLMLELLRDIIRIPSLSFEEEKRCTFLHDYLQQIGIHSTRVGNNIIATNEHFDPRKPILALDAHIDTVSPSAQYSRDPYDTGSDDSIIYGLGSNDDGGSVVTMVHTFRHYYCQHLPINLMLVLTCEEERSGPNGASLLYAPDGYLAHNQLLPRWVIVGEPTGMRAASSERGLLVIDGEAQGISAHAAHGSGSNAIYTALEDIQTIRNHRFARISTTMGEVRCNVTQICAGSAHNIIPDSCRFVIDIRPTELYANSDLLAELQALCSSRLIARNLSNKSSATYLNSPLLRTLDKLHIDTFSSATTSDWMRIHCDAIKMGPGDTQRSHKADEYILVSELEEALKIYIEFIRTFCDGYTLE